MKFDKFKELHKVNELVIAPAFYKAGLNDKGLQIVDCGKFIRSVKCDNCGAKHFHGFYRCKSKYCALCNKTKSMLWVARLFLFFKQWLQAGKYIIFVNYTWRDRADLKEGLAVGKEAWRILTHEDKTMRKEFNSRFVGGLKSLEVKIGKNSGIWHPHYHTVVLKEKYSHDKEFLMPAWQKSLEAAGGGKVGTDTQEGYVYLKSFNAYRGDRIISFEENLLKSVMEVVKYITKFDYVNETPARLRELDEGLHNVRQMNTWGVIRKISKQVEQDMDKLNDEEIENFVCQICGCDKGTLERLFVEQWKIHPILNYSTAAPDEINDNLVMKFKEVYGKIEYMDEEDETEEWEQGKFDI